MGRWVALGPASDVPEGRARVYDVEGRSIAVFHIEGSFHAVESTCRPHGAPLAEAVIDEQGVLCPWHGWRFDIVAGVCSMVPDERTPVYPTKVENGLLLVEVGPG